jgi:formylglycine-generating enzyme required for sulfatase activity
MKEQSILVVVMVSCVMTVANTVSATIVRGIDIDFVTIGNAGNPGDTRAEANPYGCGVVAYEYQIGTYEVTNAQWNAFVSAVGVPTGNPTNAYDEGPAHTDLQQPTNEVSWYEALQFCNYLTSGDKSQGVYQFSGDNANPGDFVGIDRAAALATYDTIYCLPTEDEWYKAAYYKPDGSGYSLYTNGLNTVPAADNGWNYFGGLYDAPWDVGTGTQEQNRTFDMMGNVWEWNETLIYPFGAFPRGVRGSAYSYEDITYMSSTWREFAHPPESEQAVIGFRIASIPEPTTLLLLGLGGLLLRRRR